MLPVPFQAFLHKPGVGNNVAIVDRLGEIPAVPKIRNASSTLVRIIAAHRVIPGTVACYAASVPPARLAGFLAT